MSQKTSVYCNRPGSSLKISERKRCRHDRLRYRYPCQSIAPGFRDFGIFVRHPAFPTGSCLESCRSSILGQILWAACCTIPTISIYQASQQEESNVLPFPKIKLFGRCENGDPVSRWRYLLSRNTLFLSPPTISPL